MLKHLLFLFLLLMVPGFLLPAYGTYSIVACDLQTRQCGVAVQTNNLAVGASVPYAEAGVGAVASQFETNPNYGPFGLALLKAGKTPDETLSQLLKEDGNFDGEGIEARQVGIVALNGRSTFYTGQEAANASWAGGRSGRGYSIQGNGLVGPQVVEAMENTFLNTVGSLADRLIAALVAGDAAGGQRTGRESSALLVRTPDGFPIDIDLRVDHSSNPVGELWKLYNMQSGRQQLIQAAIFIRKGQFEEGRSLMIAAVARASDWPRVLIRAAELAEQLEERQLALQYITSAFSQSPAWALQEIGSGEYAELGATPLFHHWVTAQQDQHALTAALEVRETRSSKPEDYVRTARMLLEVGRSQEALTLLNSPELSGDEKIAFLLARAEAYLATGNNADSLKECRAAAAMAPDDMRIRRKIVRLQQHLDQ